MSLPVKLLTSLAILHYSQAAQVAPYKDYRLEDLCGKKRDKQSLYLHNQAHVFTFNSTNKELMKCHLELHLHSYTFGFSVFTEVMKLDNSKDCARDFLQFGRYEVLLKLIKCKSCSFPRLLNLYFTQKSKEMRHHRTYKPYIEG